MSYKIKKLLFLAKSRVYKNKDEKNIWIIDPIDGTSFSSWHATFRYFDSTESHGEIICGLIFDPLKMRCLHEKNNGHS